MQEKIISNQDSWIISNDTVKLAITKLGGHLAPVSFYKNTSTPVKPYYISPWQSENINLDEPVLAPLRGDFFCMPFGAGCEFEGKSYRCHGEPATREWIFVNFRKEQELTELTLMQNLSESQEATITSHTCLKQGHNAVYQTHTISGCEGPMSLGHHATLAVPETEDAIRLSTSPIKFGMTAPMPEENHLDGEYYALQPEQKFETLNKVPTRWKEPAIDDCSSFPRRKGFVDIISVFNQPSSDVPAWTTAAIPSLGYLWFSLKKPDILPSTVMWMENHGRHGSPWNGRNCCIGLEDVCGYFANGLEDSAGENILNSQGIKTAIELHPEVPTEIKYIQGAVKIPSEFDRVKSVEFDDGTISFISANSLSVEAEVDWDYLFRG
jgi:hypothetical protein